MTPGHQRYWRRGLSLVRLGLILAATTLIILGWTKGLWPQRFMWPQAFGEGVFCVRTEEPIMALTFDDGPDPIYTPAILAILEEYQAKATFFAIGQHLFQYPHIAQTLVAQGHELANHTFSHPDLNRRLRQGILQEVKQTDALLGAMIPRMPPYFRPPYGHANLLVTDALKALGRPILFWDVDLRDWADPSVDHMMAILKRNAHPGAIVLLHDSSPPAAGSASKSRQKTVDVVRQILSTYIPQGYQFVTLSELLDRGETQLAARSCRPRQDRARQDLAA